jgi:hypothetical protein
MQTSPWLYDHSDMLATQDKARSTRFGPLEYTLLLLRQSGLRPSLLERLALLTSAQFRGYVNNKNSTNCYND